MKLMAQTVLLCIEEKTSEEIIAFMYRVFLSKYHIVFIVGKIELLAQQNRQILTEFINLLFTRKKEKIESCLAFAYSDKAIIVDCNREEIQ